MSVRVRKSVQSGRSESEREVVDDRACDEMELPPTPHSQHQVYIIIIYFDLIWEMGYHTCDIKERYSGSLKVYLLLALRQWYQTHYFPSESIY